MKAVTIVAAAALLFGAHAASAQTSSMQEPGVAGVKINKDARNARAKATQSRQMRRVAPVERSTTGSGIYEREIPGETPASNPNPQWNRNPDPEVPGSTLE